eukprot:356761-Chlamydomonas_euryale.AAC.9
MLSLKGQDQALHQKLTWCSKVCAACLGDKHKATCLHEAEEAEKSYGPGSSYGCAPLGGAHGPFRAVPNQRDFSTNVGRGRPHLAT